MLAEAFDLADRVVIMNKGRIEQIDAPRQLYRRPTTEFVAKFLGSANMLPHGGGGQIVIRPMMYLALSYDHRIVDGKGAVTFLVRVKEALEDPARLVLDL